MAARRQALRRAGTGACPYMLHPYGVSGGMISPLPFGLLYPVISVLRGLRKGAELALGGPGG